RGRRLLGPTRLVCRRSGTLLGCGLWLVQWLGCRAEHLADTRRAPSVAGGRVLVGLGIVARRKGIREWMTIVGILVLLQAQMAGLLLGGIATLQQNHGARMMPALVEGWQLRRCGTKWDT